MEWPMPTLASNSVPYRQRPKIDAPLLNQAVTAAIQAGWEPLSRGKPVSVLVARSAMGSLPTRPLMGSRYQRGNVELWVVGAR